MTIKHAIWLTVLNGNLGSCWLWSTIMLW